MNVRSDLSYAAEHPDHSLQNRSINSRDLYEIVVRRRNLLAPALAFSFALAFAYILLSPTRYTASMSFLIDPRERVPVGVEAQQLPQNPDPALVESQMRILTSKAVIRDVVLSANLVNDPSYRPGLVSEIINLFSLLLVPGYSGPGDAADGVVEVLAKRITAKRSERNYIVDIDVAANTPAEAVKLGNALASAYLTHQSKFGNDISDKQTLWLDQRIKALQPRVELAERLVQEYRDKNGIATLDGHTSPEQQLSTANAALVAARGKLDEVSSRYAQFKDALSQPADSESVNEAIHSPVIERLRQDYSALVRDKAYAQTMLGPLHPFNLQTEAQLQATRAQIRAEVQRLYAATERELKAAQANVQAAEKVVSSVEASTNRLSDKTLALTALQREAATLRATFEKALTARENVRRDIVESPLGTLIDPPVAGSGRTSPKTIPALLIAIAAGLNFWVAAALVAEARSRRKSAPAPAMPTINMILTGKAPSSDAFRRV